MGGQRMHGFWNSIPKPWEDPGGPEQRWLWHTVCIWSASQDKTFVDCRKCINNQSNKRERETEIELTGQVFSLRWDFRKMLFFPGTHFCILHIILQQDILCFLRWKSSALCFHFFKTKISADNACSDHKNKLQRELPSYDPDRDQACFKPK